MAVYHDYAILQEFLSKFLSSGFKDISRKDAFILKLEEHLRLNHQFFYVGDLLHFKIHFVSGGCLTMMGVEPDQWDLSCFVDRMHPDDLERYIRTRTQLIKSGYELSMKKQGISIISSNFRVKNASGKYLNLLIQGYSFCSEAPVPTIYLLLLMTDLSGFRIDPHGYHYYEGNDAANFRYPDEALLGIGHVFTDREFEIIKLIADGYGSEQIADKLALSVNTVHTHRRNILQKTKKSSTHELIIEMQERGIL